jgi:hypothetical protein
MMPKKQNPLDIQEYHPISLIHGFSKILTKLLAARQAPLLPSLISLAQCAFVQNRSIHENFKLVENTACFFHRRKWLVVLMKIDISKAFDTLSWEFFLEVLRRRGFGVIFRNLICGILRSAFTSIMINGERGPPINLAGRPPLANTLHPCYGHFTGVGIICVLQLYSKLFGIIDDTVLLVANHFNCIRQDFPIFYLGLPLTMGPTPCRHLAGDR